MKQWTIAADLFISKIHKTPVSIERHLRNHFSIIDENGDKYLVNLSINSVTFTQDEWDE